MVILRMRDGYLVPPNKKKIALHPEEKSKTSYISNPKYKSGRVDSEGMQEPTTILPKTRYVTKTEKYNEKVLYSSSREDFQHNHAKKYEPGNFNPIPALNYTMELKKLVAEAENDVRQPKHEMSVSEPMNGIEKAVEYLNETVKLLTASDHPKKDSCTKTTDSKEAARRFDIFRAPCWMPGGNTSNSSWKEAAKKHKGAIV